MTENDRWADLVQASLEIVAELRSDTRDPAILFRLSQRITEHVTALTTEEQRENWEIPWYEDQWDAVAGYANVVQGIAWSIALYMTSDGADERERLRKILASHITWVIVESLAGAANSLRREDHDRLAAWQATT